MASTYSEYVPEWAISISCRCDPQQAGSHVGALMPRDVNGKFVGTREVSAWALKSFTESFALFPIAAIRFRCLRQFRGVNGFRSCRAADACIVCPPQTYRRNSCLGRITPAPDPRHNHGAALSDTVKSVARSDHPGVRGRALQILAKVFEDRGMIRRHRSEIVQCFINSGGQAAVAT